MPTGSDASTKDGSYGGSSRSARQNWNCISVRLNKTEPLASIQDHLHDYNKTMNHYGDLLAGSVLSDTKLLGELAPHLTGVA